MSVKNISFKVIVFTYLLERTINIGCYVHIWHDLILVSGKFVNISELFISYGLLCYRTNFSNDFIDWNFNFTYFQVRKQLKKKNNENTTNHSLKAG